MSLCVPCNRTFSSETALKAHNRSSPKHVPFSCKACSRSFSTHAGLSSHQENSTAHQKPRTDSVTTSVTPAPFTQYVPMPFSTSFDVPPAIQSGHRSGHTTTENISRADPTFDSASTPLEDTLQALTISDIDTTLVRSKIGRTRIPKLQKETRTSFTFPELHQRITEAVAPAITSTWFNHNTEAHFEHEYGTNIVGTFRCVNNRCGKKGWSSGVVAIWIYGYSRNGYNAIVYNQRCKVCDWLGSLKMDEESYVERIAYRLKRWAGVRVEQPSFSHKLLRGPHESEHCEGCKAGRCSRADNVLE
jgi:hypothetical protein